MTHYGDLRAWAQATLFTESGLALKWGTDPLARLPLQAGPRGAAPGTQGGLCMDGTLTFLSHLPPPFSAVLHAYLHSLGEPGRGAKGGGEGGSPGPVRGAAPGAWRGTASDLE